jgi:hypothetical protein
LSLKWETGDAYVSKRFELFYIQIQKRKYSVPFLKTASPTEKKTVQKYIFPFMMCLNTADVPLYSQKIQAFYKVKLPCSET